MGINNLLQTIKKANGLEKSVSLSWGLKERKRERERNDFNSIFIPRGEETRTTSTGTTTTKTILENK